MSRQTGHLRVHKFMNPYFFDFVAKIRHNKSSYMTINSRPKVLIFSVTYFPFVGGAEVALKEIIERLPNWQFDLITAKISQDLSDKEVLGNLRIFRVGTGHKFDKYLSPRGLFYWPKDYIKKIIILSFGPCWKHMPAWPHSFSNSNSQPLSIY